MDSARSYLVNEANLLETRPGEFGIIARTPLGVLRSAWNEMLEGIPNQYSDILSEWRTRYGDKNIFDAKITRVRLSFPEMHRNTRIRVLSTLFSRTINSGKDMSYGEALALIALAYPKGSLEVRPEYTNFINRVIEEVTEFA